MIQVTTILHKSLTCNYIILTLKCALFDSISIIQATKLLHQSHQSCSFITLSPKSRLFSICDILQANFKYKYKGGCAISTQPPTKVEWCFAKSALKVPTKSLRIFLSEFQWTPTDRDHQSITQSRLGG